jgi:hypothetical protein
MDGFSRWDLVLWVVVVYAVVTGVMVTIHGRETLKERFRDALKHIHRGPRG